MYKVKATKNNFKKKVRQLNQKQKMDLLLDMEKELIKLNGFAKLDLIDKEKKGYVKLLKKKIAILNTIIEEDK